jgi:mycofactocin precursor
MQVLALGAITTREVPMAEHDETEVLATDELLVEEISIDGMCGVY